MDEYLSGTQDTSWYDLGHYSTAAVVVDTIGNPVTYDIGQSRFEYTIANGTHLVGDPVDISDPFYAAQIMDSRANGGSGTNYREYHVLSPREGRDEELQVLEAQLGLEVDGLQGFRAGRGHWGILGSACLWTESDVLQGVV